MIPFALSSIAPPIALQRLDGAQTLAAIDVLADVLIDCVQGGASVSFMQPLTRERATAFWRKVAEGVARGERALLVARWREPGSARDGEIVGQPPLAPSARHQRTK